MIQNFVGISQWFRGKLVTLNDLLNMDIGFVAILNRMAYEESMNSDSVKRKQAETVEDAIIYEGIV